MTDHHPPDRVCETLTEQTARDLTAAFIHYRLPRMLRLLEQVGDADPLTTDDNAFLTETLASLSNAVGALGRDRDIEAVHRCAINLYDDIATVAHRADAPRSVAGR